MIFQLFCVNCIFFKASLPLPEAELAPFKDWAKSSSSSSLDHPHNRAIRKVMIMMTILPNLWRGLTRLPEGLERFQKKENHQNLTPKIMSKSNPVHLWRFGRTRALIFTQKLLNRVTPSKNKNGQESNFLGLSSKKNPVSGRAMVRDITMHFDALFVHKFTNSQINSTTSWPIGSLSLQKHLNLALEFF